MTAPLLEIRDLRIEYRSRRAVHVAVAGATLAVAAGETVALVGESGSGKTSIGRAVLGLHRPSTRIAGSIALDGTELVGLPERAWRRIRGRDVALVPQDPMAALNPLRRVGSQVAEALTAHGTAAREARELTVQAMRDAGLPRAEELAQRYPHQLSGGQRQRVLIAMALVGRPRLIVADEPTSALDVTVQRTILDGLQELTRSTGTSLLLITHDLAVAAERAERIVALSDGAIVEEGPARAIVTEPQHAYTRALIASLPQHHPHPLVEPAEEDAPLLLAGVGLRKAFGSGDRATVALDDVDVTLRRGQTLGVVGESGSGKTTLARVLLGLTAPDAGTTRLDGRDEPQGSRSRDFRRRVQPVFQDPYSSLDPSHSVGHAVLEPVRALTGLGGRERRRRLDEVLDQVRLPRAVVHRLPSELSGGQLQRVAIARALSVEPELLICDEPVSALDVTIQAQILELLAELRRERGLSYVFITHDLSVLQLVCDTVLVMRDGRVVERGRTGAVFAAPEAAYTRELIDAIPAWAGGDGVAAAVSG